YPMSSCGKITGRRGILSAHNLLRSILSGRPHNLATVDRRGLTEVSALKYFRGVVMRVISFVLIVIFVVAIGNAALVDNVAAVNDPYVTVISSEAAEVNLEFDLSMIDCQAVDGDGELLDAHILPGEGTTYEYGMPLLPAVSRFVVVHPQAGLELVVRADNPRTERAEHPPLLCLDEDLIQDENGELIEVDIPPLNELYPPHVAEMSEPTIVRGVRLVKITTYPVQYDPTSNSYIYNEHIETDIRTTDSEPINPVDHPIRSNRSREFLKVISALAINGDIVGRDDPDADFEPEYVGHYLIVTHESALQYMGPFIEWRRKGGYKVDILSLSNNSAGNANLVKGEIQDRYDAYLDDGIDPFDYILLVGDRSQYYYQPSPGWILQAETAAGNGNAPHADFRYACLEGNDDHPETAISRFPSGNRDMVELAVGRTLYYEAEPYMEDTTWFTRGAMYSQHWGNGANSAWHITIHTNARWGAEVLEQHGYDDVTFYEEYDWDQFGQRVGPVVRDLMNEGANVMLGRAENYYFVDNRGNHNFMQEIDDNVVFPVEINTSGHGEWASEIMFRRGSGNHLKGWAATDIRMESTGEHSDERHMDGDE
ncbi:MAG: C25 family cysteine peptidase, partial [Candidatus Electryoneaceae bacterium]|nr:C25 family cysteine peptidase [Candidatus Electryoneaceae bacterium]